MKMTTRRRLLTAASLAQHGRLPTGYIEVEWLQGTGVQYCETGVYPIRNTSNFTAIRGDVTVLDKEHSHFKIGAFWRDTSTGTPRALEYTCAYYYGLMITGQYTARFRLQDGTTERSHIAFDFTNYVFPLDVHYELNYNNVVVNSSAFERTSSLEYQSTSQLIIGGSSTATSTVNIDNDRVRIKPFNIYNKNNLLYNFVPCYRISDNKTGFMRISAVDGSAEFFPNMGNTEWVIGPTV